MSFTYHGEIIRATGLSAGDSVPFDFVAAPSTPTVASYLLAQVLSSFTGPGVIAPGYALTVAARAAPCYWDRGFDPVAFSSALGTLGNETWTGASSTGTAWTGGVHSSVSALGYSAFLFGRVAPDLELLIDLAPGCTIPDAGSVALLVHHFTGVRNFLPLGTSELVNTDHQGGFTSGFTTHSDAACVAILGCAPQQRVDPNLSPSGTYGATSAPFDSGPGTIGDLSSLIVDYPDIEGRAFAGLASVASPGSTFSVSFAFNNPGTFLFGGNPALVDPRHYFPSGTGAGIFAAEEIRADAGGFPCSTTEALLHLDASYDPAGPALTAGSGADIDAVHLHGRWTPAS